MKPKSNDWLICINWLNYIYVYVCVLQLNVRYQESKMKYIYINLSTHRVNGIRTDQIIYSFLYLCISRKFFFFLYSNVCSFPNYISLLRFLNVFSLSRRILSDFIGIYMLLILIQSNWNMSPYLRGKTVNHTKNQMVELKPNKFHTQTRGRQMKIVNGK